MNENDNRRLRDIDYETLSYTARNNPVGFVIPFFFNVLGSMVPLVGEFRGGSAFLIGGGPSLKTVDLNCLNHVWKMTLNNGPATIRGQANCIVDDPDRFSLSMWLDPTIMKFVPMGKFEKRLWDNRRVKSDGEWTQKWERSELRVRDCPNVVGYRRNEKFHPRRWLYEETINWGNHNKYGAGRSVMLAAMRILFLLGFRRVYLLGVDFEMSEDKKYHFDEDRTASSIRGNTITYGKLQKWFSELQPYFLKEKFVVKNCNPESLLKAFPYMPLNEALEEALTPLGDFREERTKGMYITKEKKAEQGAVAVAAPEKEADCGRDSAMTRSAEAMPAGTHAPRDITND